MILNKEQLISNGYLTFNVRDIDESLYIRSKEFFTKEFLFSQINALRFDSGFYDLYESNIKSYKNYIETTIRSFGIDTIQTQFNGSPDFNVHITLKGTYDNLKNSLKFLKKIKTNTFQHWYFGEPNLHKFIDVYSLIYDIYDKIPKSLYINDIANVEKYQKSITDNTNISLYTKDDFIRNHNDGLDPNRLCVFLMYLNDDYKPGVGGEIKIGDTIVEPIFGNIVILDFTQNNPLHEVLPVLNDDFYRYALIKFFYK